MLFRGLTFVTSLVWATWVWSAPNDWSGMAESSASLFRGGSGITNPLAYGLPSWLRGNNADLDFLAKNPALAASLNENRRRWYPVMIQARQAGSLLDVSNAFQNPGTDMQKLREQVDALGTEPQRAAVGLHTLYLVNNFAWGVSYVQRRHLWMEGKAFNYQLFRDLAIQFNGAGLISEGDWGRLDAGITVKAVTRFGGDFRYSPAQLAETGPISDADFLYQGFGPGLDFGLLYTSLGTEQENSFGWQVGFVSRDVGTTNFLTAAPIAKLFGFDPPGVLKFPFLPNVLGAGLGIKLPNFRDGLRSALRLEYTEWTRPIPAGDKWSVSYELRLPVWATFYVGYRAGQTSGGVGFRFPGLELDVGSYSEIWGNGAKREPSRGILVELRSVL